MPKTPKKLKLFVVKKYIMAADIDEVLRVENRRKPDDVWVDDDWRKANMDDDKPIDGFKPHAKA